MPTYKIIYYPEQSGSEENLIVKKEASYVEDWTHVEKSETGLIVYKYIKNYKTFLEATDCGPKVIMDFILEEEYSKIHIWSVVYSPQYVEVAVKLAGTKYGYLKGSLSSINDPLGMVHTFDYGEKYRVYLESNKPLLEIAKDGMDRIENEISRVQLDKTMDILRSKKCI